MRAYNMLFNSEIKYINCIMNHLKENESKIELSDFFHAKVREIIAEKYPEEYTDNLTKEEFEKLLLRLVHDNDMNLKWEKASAYGGSVDDHLEFQTGSEVKQSAQKVDKFLAPFAKTKWAS